MEKVDEDSHILKKTAKMPGFVQRTKIEMF